MKAAEIVLSNTDWSLLAPQREALAAAMQAQDERAKTSRQAGLTAQAEEEEQTAISLGNLLGWVDALSAAAEQDGLPVVYLT